MVSEDLVQQDVQVNQHRPRAPLGNPESQLLRDPGKGWGPSNLHQIPEITDSQPALCTVLC